MGAVIVSKYIISKFDTNINRYHDVSKNIIHFDILPTPTSGMKAYSFNCSTLGIQPFFLLLSLSLYFLLYYYYCCLSRIIEINQYSSCEEVTEYLKEELGIPQMFCQLFIGPEKFAHNY